jgi:hypothetical protein
MSTVRGPVKPRHCHDQSSFVGQFLDDECRHQSVFYLGQSRSPGLVLALSGESLGETAEQRIAGHLFKHRTLDTAANRLSLRGAGGKSNEKQITMTSSSDRI